MADFSTKKYMSFNTPEELHDLIEYVLTALQERGHNPEAQLCGYLISGDPTYITAYNGARALIVKADRYDILTYVIQNYVQKNLQMSNTT